MAHGSRCLVVILFIAGMVGQSWALTGPLALPSPSPSRQSLARLMPMITAVLSYPDGTTEVQRGYGVMIGRHLFTANHTLIPHAGEGVTTRQIYVDNILITPSYTHVNHDIAMFELPEALCAQYCNTLTDADGHIALPNLEANRRVYWVQEDSAAQSLREGRVRHYAWVGEAPPDAESSGAPQCRGNLVVEVDTPFRPGTSGGPVFDVATGAILGMIQGSFVHGGETTGYFKPLACLLPLLS